MRHTLIYPLVLLLVACEGAEKDKADTPNPEPTAATAEGMWTGTASNGRAFTGFVLDDGTYWVLYASATNPAVLAGGVQGTGTSTNGSFASSNARDFNLEGLGIQSATLSASYFAQQSWNGMISYSNGQTLSLAGQYSSQYDTAATLAAVAGSYTGSAGVLEGSESASLTISAGGAVAGGSVGGCQYSGTVTPRAKGNAYDLRITFGGGVCSNGTDTVTGIGYYDAASNRLWGAALNAGRSNGFIFSGTKPVTSLPIFK